MHTVSFWTDQNVPIISTEKIFMEGDEYLTLRSNSLQYTGTSGHVNLISSQSETHS